MSTWFTTYGYAEVYPDLLVGPYPRDADDVLTLRALGVERVLNLAEDCEYQPGDRQAVAAAYTELSIVEQRIGLVDFGRLPAPQIEAGVLTIVGWVREGRRCYVHCRAGRQRSAALAAGAVAVRENLPVRDALRYVRARKANADPLPDQRTDLDRWWAERLDHPPR
jgi:atypical dual specificity phosphatase